MLVGQVTYCFMHLLLFISCMPSSSSTDPGFCQCSVHHLLCCSHSSSFLHSSCSLTWLWNLKHCLKVQVGSSINISIPWKTNKAHSSKRDAGGRISSWNLFVTNVLHLLFFCQQASGFACFGTHVVFTLHFPPFFLL